MKKIRVTLGKRSYSIEIGTGLLDGLAERLAPFENVSRYLIVTDENVAELYADRVDEVLSVTEPPIDLFVIPAGEKSKSIELATALWDGFLAAGADRNALVIALGGGVVGDLAGFVAATFMRGVRFFQIPTTLLAQVDSSVGGKTGIDLVKGKNSVGAFHQPLGVLIDPTVLQTLPEREFRAGLGEIVKYAVGLDVELFEKLENQADEINARDPTILAEIVDRCCRIKADIVRADEKETTGLRALLNLGHTFAHAYEMAGDYSDILHGEAVSLGILDALNLARRLARSEVADFEEVGAGLISRTQRLFKSLSLPTTLAPFRKKGKKTEMVWNQATLLESMRRDKKSDKGNLRFVLPTGLGQSALFTGIPERTVLAVLRDRVTIQ